MIRLACIFAILFAVIGAQIAPARTVYNSGGIVYSSGSFIGTSITRGARVDLSVTFAQALPNLVGVSKRFGPSINAGVSGDTSTQMLARFERDVLAYGPSMVSIEAGYNDPGSGINTTTTESNVTAMILAARRAGARVTLWVPTYSCDNTLNTSIAPYRTVIRNLATTYSTDLFDTYNDFVALPGATQTAYFLPGDCQHFSPAGLAWMAGLVGSGAYANSFVSAVQR